MEKDSALYQLMDTRMNGVMDGITNSDAEYQEILRRSDEYSGRLERVGLPVDVYLSISSSENSPSSGMAGCSMSLRRFSGLPLTSPLLPFQISIENC